LDDANVGREVNDLGGQKEKKKEGKRRRRSEKKKPSVVYLMFEKTQNDKEFRCKLSEFSNNARHPALVKVGKGTSNLLSHARTYHAVIIDGLVKSHNDGRDASLDWNSLFAALKKPVTPGTLDRHVKVVKRSEKLLRLQVSLVNFLIANSLPFVILDSVFFEQFCSEAGVVLQTEGTVMKILQPLYEIVVAEMEGLYRAAGLFSLTFDMWTSVAKQKYLAVTYHSMSSEFELFGFVLDLVPMGCSA
jgi:hypothetical protein